MTVAASGLVADWSRRAGSTVAVRGGVRGMGLRSLEGTGYWPGMAGCTPRKMTRLPARNGLRFYFMKASRAG